MSERLKQLAAAGTSPWLDNIRRSWLESGEFKGMVNEGIVGVTSNPTIFQKAIADSSDYDDAIHAMHGKGASAQDVFFELAIEDVQAAADQLAGVYRDTGHLDGFVSFELPPGMANDTAGVDHRRPPVLEAHRPAQHLHQDPGHCRGRAGDRGVDRRRRERQRDAALLAGCATTSHPLGLHPRPGAAGRGRPADRRPALRGQLLRLPGGHRRRQAAARGLAAGAARRPSPTPSWRTSTSSRSPPAIAGRRWQAHGARVQRPLWASTGTKNPAYSDVLYVDDADRARTASTRCPTPPSRRSPTTAWSRARSTPTWTAPAARSTQVAAAGISLDAVTRQLELDGVKSFSESFDSLLGTIEERLARDGGRSAA